ncbi:hypothetical protein HZY86_06425 [Aerococcaceae bacterium DSM 111020]|nr:hypothetical protein [Aerococcaceae bacterium DSM 111020]
MNLWWVVIGLFIIAIILLVISMFSKDSTNEELEDKFNRYMEEQSQELFSIKTRISELENTVFDQSSSTSETNDTVTDTTFVSENDTEVITDINDVEDDIREAVINDYAQGYTMHEISNHVGISTGTVQAIIDDYIENR